MTIRSFFFWPHLVAGVSAGLVILMMSFTGVLLMYERQLIALADSSYRSAPSAAAVPLPVEALLTRLRNERPDLKPTAVTVAAAPGAPVLVAAGQGPLVVDAYTGAVLGESAPRVRRTMALLRAWHRWLAVDGAQRPLARAITGWANALFLLIVCSGFYLWFPRKWTWTQVKGVVLFKGGLRGKARDFNWHNVIGVWSAVPLFIVVLCAVPMSFPWANALVYRIVGDEVPRPPARAEVPAGRARRAERLPSTDGLDELMASAQRQVPGWRTINVRIPTSPTAPAVFAIDRGDGGQPHLRSTLTLDRGTGAVVSHEGFSDLTLGRRIRNVMRFAHTGEVLGIAGQTIAGLASAGGVVLVCTGILLACRRFRAWLRRRSDRATQTSTSARSTAA
jgi:uncharacterized iron-regulated membrane protein